MMQVKDTSIIKECEGLYLKSYLCPADVWTIGYGHTKGVKPKQVITEEQANQYLLDDLQVSLGAVNRLVKVKLSQNQFDALVSFTFNLGQGALAGSTLLRKLNSGDYEGAANEFPKWNGAGGKVLAGLVRRRKMEQDLFKKV